MPCIRKPVNNHKAPCRLIHMTVDRDHDKLHPKHVALSSARNSRSRQKARSTSKATVVSASSNTLYIQATPCIGNLSSVQSAILPVPRTNSRTSVTVVHEHEDVLKQLVSTYRSTDIGKAITAAIDKQTYNDADKRGLFYSRASILIWKVICTLGRPNGDNTACNIEL